MTIKEAISERHTVRKFTDKPLSKEICDQLNDRIHELNKTHGIRLEFITNSTDGFGPLIKLILAKGVRNYIVLAGPDKDDTDEKIGYCGADIILFAQTLGLNSWWVGMTFSKNKMSKKITATSTEKVIGLIAIGYGKDSGKPHKSKNIEDVSHYNGDKIPQWFTDGVKAALLAPTATNKQGFKIEGTENKVEITCNNGIFTQTDLGIIKYHFEVGAGKENFIYKK